MTWRTHDREDVISPYSSRFAADPHIALVSTRGPPRRVALGISAHGCGVQLDFTRRGKPTDNSHIESFNGRLRDECLNVHQFLSIDHARATIEAWRQDYNEVRPHGSLGDLTPAESIKIRQERRTENAGSF